MFLELAWDSGVDLDKEEVSEWDMRGGVIG
jgi:hypothetical protein